MDQDNILFTVIAVIFGVQGILTQVFYFRLRSIYLDVEYLKKVVALLEKSDGGYVK